MSLSDTPTHSTDDDDDIDLLDLLIVIAENLKLLILLPLLVGVLALGVSFALPQTFESTSLLNPAKRGMNVQGAALASYLKSADILNTVATELDFEPEFSPRRRVKALEKQIQVSVGKQDQLITLTTQGHTPEAAQQLNLTLWKHALRETIPRPQEMQRLQSELKAEQGRLSSGETLEASTAKLLARGETNESTARLYGELLASNSARLRTIATLESQMEGLTPDNLAQQPTLAETAIKPKKALLAIAATLGAGFLVLLFIFARHALRTAGQHPEQAGKVARLRRALGCKA